MGWVPALTLGIPGQDLLKAKLRPNKRQPLALVTTPAKHPAPRASPFWEGAPPNSQLTIRAQPVHPWLSPFSPGHPCLARLFLQQELSLEALCILRTRPGAPESQHDSRKPRRLAEGATGPQTLPEHRQALPLQPPQHGSICPLLELPSDGELSLWAKRGGPVDHMIQSGSLSPCPRSDCILLCDSRKAT